MILSTRTSAHARRPTWVSTPHALVPAAISISRVIKVLGEVWNERDDLRAIHHLHVLRLSSPYWNDIAEAAIHSWLEERLAVLTSSYVKWDGKGSFVYPPEFKSLFRAFKSGVESYNPYFPSPDTASAVTSEFFVNWIEKRYLESSAPDEAATMAAIRAEAEKSKDRDWLAASLVDPAEASTHDQNFAIARQPVVTFFRAITLSHRCSDFGLVALASHIAPNELAPLFILMLATSGIRAKHCTITSNVTHIWGCIVARDKKLGRSATLYLPSC